MPDDDVPVEQKAKAQLLANSLVVGLRAWCEVFADEESTPEAMCLIGTAQFAAAVIVAAGEEHEPGSARRAFDVLLDAMIAEPGVPILDREALEATEAFALWEKIEKIDEPERGNGLLDGRG